LECRKVGKENDFATTYTWAENVACITTYVGEERCIEGFDGETCGKEPLERPRRRWEDDVKRGS
jgi:hypothetical protein